MGYLEIPLVNAERAWAYGVQLKADNATASAVNPQWRLHSIRRFAKAAKWARFLESVCKVHADARTQLEAEAYAAFMSGTLLCEKEQWSEALPKLKRCIKVCEHLSLASEQAEAMMFRQQAQDLAPAIRECKYNLGTDFEDDEEERAEPAVSTPVASKELSELSYRGHSLVVQSEKVKGQLTKCMQSIGAV